MAQLIEAYEPTGAIALAQGYSQEFLECLLLQTYEHRMSAEDRAKRDAEDVLNKQKPELLSKEFSVKITGEKIPRIISMANFFPTNNGALNNGHQVNH